MKAISRGFTINYEVTGRGEALVLIPGLMQNIEDWREEGYIDPLSTMFRVVVVDPLGHGNSDKPYEGAAYLRDDVAGDIIAVLDAEGIESAHIWGYSRGAGIALRIGTAFPVRVKSLIAGGTNLAPPGTPASMRASGQDTSKALRAGDWGEFFGVLGLGH